MSHYQYCPRCRKAKLNKFCDICGTKLRSPESQGEKRKVINAAVAQVMREHHLNIPHKGRQIRRLYFIQDYGMNNKNIIKDSSPSSMHLLICL